MSNNIIGKCQGIPISLLSAKENEIIVAHLDTNQYKVSEAKAIYDMLTKQLSGSVNLILIPTGIDLTVESIDHLIDYLKELKE